MAEAPPTLPREPAGAPSPRTLVLLRHGRTSWNASGRVQGQIDSELDETGLAQAEAVAPHIAAYRPVAVWTSDLQRAAVTASYVAREAGLELRTDPRLREFGLGEREGITHAEYSAAHPCEYADFVTGRWSSVPGAEGVEDVRSRTTACLTELAASIAPGEVAVGVAHGAALRVAVEGLVAGTASEPSAYAGMDNCGWAVLRERHAPRDGEPSWRLVAYNRTAPDPRFAQSRTAG
ncbi:histidine phosphatase family protein [Nocardioides alkalitolerans]|uniref:histidine phosphatase family protein n=1 Tax=Nocardioides alkalitolerans TaxID=281714 RepID=UPI0009FFEF2A|nr:histidine phosphatase family protein [Nocardioides alkalitolerans]